MAILCNHELEIKHQINSFDFVCPCSLIGSVGCIYIPRCFPQLEPNFSVKLKKVAANLEHSQGDTHFALRIREWT